MTQPDLFSYNPERTRRIAKKSVRNLTSSLKTRILRLLIHYPDGLTDEQIQQYLDMNPSTQRPRRGELVAAGMLLDSGQTRPTTSGRPAVVWTLSPCLANPCNQPDCKVCPAKESDCE